MAGVAIVLFLLLLVVAVNSCRTSQRENALKDYNRQLSTVATESEQQVGQPFFQLLSEGGGSPQDLQTAISGYRVQAEQQYRQVEELDVPGAMEGAQESALIALEWRRDGLDYIAQRIGTALGDEGDESTEAINQITGQMQVFLASDVAWRTRVAPFVQNALDESEVGGQDIVVSRFMQTNAWLDPQTVATELEQSLTSGGGGGAGGEPTGPGLHGTGIDSTTYGDTTLQPGVANTLTYVEGQPFIVSFTNQGENDEFDIRVSVRIVPDGGDPITAADTVERLVQGETATVELTPDPAPPTSTATTIQVRVAPVPGEEMTDNNRSEYQAQFVE